jgi:hypothetical protein
LGGEIVEAVEEERIFYPEEPIVGLRIRRGFNIRYRVGIDKPSKPVFVGIVRNTSYLAIKELNLANASTLFGLRR